MRKILPHYVFIETLINFDITTRVNADFWLQKSVCNRIVMVSHCNEELNTSQKLVVIGTVQLSSTFATCRILRSLYQDSIREGSYTSLTAARGQNRLCLFYLLLQSKH